MAKCSNRKMIFPWAAANFMDFFLQRQAQDVFLAYLGNEASQNFENAQILGIEPTWNIGRTLLNCQTLNQHQPAINACLSIFVETLQIKCWIDTSCNFVNFLAPSHLCMSWSKFWTWRRKLDPNSYPSFPITLIAISFKVLNRLVNRSWVCVPCVSPLVHSRQLRRAKCTMASY